VFRLYSLAAVGLVVFCCAYAAMIWFHPATYAVTAFTLAIAGAIHWIEYCDD
jgi:hypothetical protein